MIVITQDFSQSLLNWYDHHRRDLPWRPPMTAAPHVRPDPYFVLVSEAMLQQTQVATVIGYFTRFTAALPTVEALAAADEQQVLKLWQGLGYYSRARNLKKAAEMIVERFAGRVPATINELLTLPGVGRYTAGAIASIAHGTRAPIVDGNVVRVLCRLDKILHDPRGRSVQTLLWSRAEEILPTERVDAFNSGLMELGATVCTPRKPSCLICPVQQFCAAFASGVQEKIPPPKKTRPLKKERRLIVCLRGPGDRYLVEQRPARGRWAGMWQFVTFPLPDEPASAVTVSALCGQPVSDVAHLAVVTHVLTHRHYTFTAVIASAGKIDSGRWLTLDEIRALPLSKPQGKILALLARKAAA